MSCGDGGSSKSVYTGNQVGDLNHTGDMNYMAGGPAASGLSASTTTIVTTPNGLNRRPWLRSDAKFNDQLLDAAYPTMELQWFVEINLEPGSFFRLSDKPFYVQDENGDSRYYDPRIEKPPSISVTVGEWLSPNYESSDATFSINNRDGFFNEYLPGGAKFRNWSGASVIVKVGFGEKYENYHTIFEGQVTVKQGLTATRDTITVKAYDKLDLDEVPLPPRVYTSDTYPDMDTAYAGKPVPLIYGDWSQDVPDYGSLFAVCVNALEEEPIEYTFKISDIELEEISEIWLHRGDHSATSPLGPILIDSNCVIPNLEMGQFVIPANAPVFQQPVIVLDRAKCGPGTAVGTITSDGSINFVTAGVKVGDRLTDNTEKTASANYENLKFIARRTGSAPKNGTLGNGITVDYIYSATNPDPKATIGLVVTVVGNAITVDIQSKLVGGVPVYATHTASAIKSAISKSQAADALVQTVLTGSVPGGYPFGTTVGQVVQTVPSGTITLAGGVDGANSGVVTSVTNYQLGVSGGIVFTEGYEYTIRTTQYTFKRSDKMSVKCKGKPLNLVSMDRLSKVSPDILAPSALAFSVVDYTYWVSDDATQKIYNVGAGSKILQEIAYADIDASMTSVGSLSMGPDQKLWIASIDQSKIYRYDPAVGTVGLSYSTADIVGIAAVVGELAGISVKSSNEVWLCDNTSGDFWLVDMFSGAQPSVTLTFNRSIFDTSAVDIQDISYDQVNGELMVVDRTTNLVYRLDETNGELNSSFLASDISDNVAYITGLSVAQDESVFYVDAGTLSIYNYNEQEDASTNPAFIARDLLQKFGGHEYSEFDISWNDTARQLNVYKCRAAVVDKSNLITYLNKLLAQFNTVFHLRFGRFGLFYIHFDNFRTDGRLVKEKDIKEGSFKAEKEMNQYFNSITSTYNHRPFDGAKESSDTYVSPAGVAFSGRETNKTIDLSAIYRREDLDRVLPLLVKLSVPEPEFIDVTFGFRLLRTQIQDFLTLNFDGDVNCLTGLKDSGRRFENVPCMVRKLQYNLSDMSITMKLWSLQSTAFDGWVPPGRTVGGEDDEIVLSNLGRAGRISAIGKITAAGTDSVTLATHEGVNAEEREASPSGLCWRPGFVVEVIDGSTKDVVQTLTIESVSGNTVTFTEDLTTPPSATTMNSAGFITGGHFIQYARYNNATVDQRAAFASICPPLTNYPRTNTTELEEQRSGAHAFDDGGVPYVLYPVGFAQY